MIEELKEGWQDLLFMSSVIGFAVLYMNHVLVISPEERARREAKKGQNP